jgi:hypothetical protein
MNLMQCPTCGYESIADEAVFCPHCRHQFRELESDVVFETPHFPPMDHRVRTPGTDEKLSKREIHMIQIQLIQPAVLIMIAVGAVLYAGIGPVQGMAITLSSIEIRYGGFLCIVTGAVIAWFFYRISLYRIEAS